MSLCHFTLQFKVKYVTWEKKLKKQIVMWNTTWVMWNVTSFDVKTKLEFFGKFIKVTYGVNLEWFCTITFLKWRATHVQVCKSFRNKIIWRPKANFSFWSNFHFFFGNSHFINMEGESWMVYVNEFLHKNTIGVGDFMPFKDKKNWRFVHRRGKVVCMESILTSFSIVTSCVGKHPISSCTSDGMPCH